MNRDHAPFDDPDFYNPPPDIKKAISKAKEHIDVSGGSYELKSGEGMYITYTFHFLNLVPDSNNKLQGKKAQHSLQFIFFALPGGNPGGGGDGGGGGGEKNPQLQMT
jgi:hypothetical protein